MEKPAERYLDSKRRGLARLIRAFRVTGQLAAPVLIIALALRWSLAIPPVPGAASPPDALLVLAAITLLTVIVILWFQRVISIGSRATKSLPLPLYTLYLAAVILAGTTGAVALAAIASLYTLFPDAVRRPLRLARITVTLRRATLAAVTTLAAGAVYFAASALLPVDARVLHVRLIAGLAATLVMLAGVSLTRVMEWGLDAAWSPVAWATYLRSPAFRYQVLLLSVGPLLPLVEVLDDVEAELAWILFLVPLYAIYYLALLSARLEERTDELQRTVAALAVARQREAELTGYAALVTRAQEEERRRLARELHDDTAQALVALSRGLDALSTRQADPPLSPGDRRFLEGLGDLAKRTLDSIRRACQDLRPSVLDDLGLAAALESLATAMAARGLPCAYIQTGESRPCPPEVEMTVYRIAQEALSNALRHALATQTTVELSYSADFLRLVVRDNGRGFAAARTYPVAPVNSGDPEAGSGLGLLGMRERAALIGATLDVASVPGEGTSITLRMPLLVLRPERPSMAGPV